MAFRKCHIPEKDLNSLNFHMHFHTSNFIFRFTDKNVLRTLKVITFTVSLQMTRQTQETLVNKYSNETCWWYQNISTGNIAKVRCAW